MANRVSIYGKPGETHTERLRRELRSMSLTYNFYDIASQPAAATRAYEAGSTDPIFPKVEIVCANNPGTVFLTNPDVDTLRQQLYAEEILGVTSYWV
ncbi:MAG TPA: hypothetical protein VGK19_14890 [Capsulimonadaceae bacterium]|jgi:hypothetical protein